MYLVAIAWSLTGKPHGDETYHFAQIEQFLHGEWRGPDTHLSTIPGYHVLLAGLMWLTSLDSLGSARLLNALLGIPAIGAFYFLRRGLWPGNERLATAQWVVLPILAPLFFLVYTDVLALGLVLWAFVAGFAGRYVVAAMVLSVDMLVRQNDVVWAGLLPAICVWPVLRASGFGNWRELLRRTLPFALPVAIFIAYWIWHGSLTWSRAEAPLHPELGLHVGSPAFAVLIAAALMPIQLYFGLADFVRSLAHSPWLILVPLALFVVYFFAFHADNPYNTVVSNLYPRNWLLQKIDHDVVWRVVTGFVFALGCVALVATPLRPVGAAWLYPFALFFLASSWLIDQRYMLLAFSLWLAFREPRSRPIEIATLALWSCLAIGIYAGIVNHQLFI